MAKKEGLADTGKAVEETVTAQPQEVLDELAQLRTENENLRTENAHLKEINAKLAADLENRAAAAGEPVLDMTPRKWKAPAGHGSIGVDGAIFVPNEAGEFEAPSCHTEALKRAGCQYLG